MPSPTFEFSVFDNQELVTYAPVTGAAVSNVPALRRPLTQSRQRNVERYVDLQVSDVIFHLDGASLAGATLATNDVITDANNHSYNVLFVERQTLGSVVGHQPVDFDLAIGRLCINRCRKTFLDERPQHG